MAHLNTKVWLDEHLAELTYWQQDAFRQFTSMIADPEGKYPCIPGRQGFLSNHLRFGFVADPRSEESTIEVAQLLRQYGECSRDTGKYASLVLFFETPEDLAKGFTIEEYEDLFWSVLDRVSTVDTVPWPDEISTDPSHPSWEFCFDGHPYFAFCATPAHELRRSRHTPYFVIAFQPRWVFENINDSTAFGRNMKKQIRKKLADYDSVPAHPSLQWYGQEDSLEWKQYFLRDDESAPSKCPYTYMKNKFKAIGIKFHS
ncbi:YqcI/YcgG family protein [Paenibacillus sp. FSL F4-0125]|uniref:YqcI/YcgG family protein n=1 Tax=Paenibacillus sp. FSL F4-0125 TaxID=2954730 RepID=UPI0030F5E837